MGLLARRRYLFVAILYCLGTVCSAKKDKDPTMAPTKQPKDNGPQDGNNPDDDPPEVTDDGTPPIPDDNSPVLSPAMEFLTTSPAPTLRPTMFPSAAPTRSPSASPTASPTGSPTDLADVEVKLAMFSLDTTTDGGQLDVKRLESDLEDILTNEVLHGVYTYFGHVTLDVTEVTESTPTERRQLQEQSIRVDVDGSAWFTDESDLPSEDQLSDFVSTYLFSIYQSDDLTQRLQDGNPSITMAEFVVPVDAGAGNVTDKSTNEAGSGISSSSLSVGAIAGVAAAGAVLVFAVGLIVWQARRRKGLTERINVSMERKRAKPASSPARTAAGTPDRDTDSFVLGENNDDLSVDLSLGASSTADSIYTSNSDLNFLKSKKKDPPPEGYDAKRLDLVIQSAQQFSAERSTKNFNKPSSL